MNPLATWWTYRALCRTQWWDAERLRRRQDEKLRQLTRHAYDTVPYYRRLFDQAGLDPDGFRGLEDLERIPVTTKADLQHAAAREELSSTAFSPAQLRPERTSGSSGRPFVVLMDPRFIAVRDALFLRALASAGYKLGQRLFLLTSTREKPARRWLPWHYASIEAPPERVLSRLLAARPRVVYGCMSALRAVASLAARTGQRITGVRSVVSTAEPLDATTRDLLSDAFAALVFDAYGLTEMGMIGWECRERTGYHLAEDTTVVECLQSASHAPARRIVATNLELRAMPMLRIDTGDLGPPLAREPCRCGRRLARLPRIEGRAVDSVLLPDGEVLSPYRITCEIERIAGVRRYQVIQDELSRFTVRIEPAAGSDVVASVTPVLKKVLGENAEITVLVVERLVAPPGRKFRIVESRIPRSGEATPSR